MCGGFTLLGSLTPPQLFYHSPSLDEEGEKKLCWKERKNKQTNKQTKTHGLR